LAGGSAERRDARTIIGNQRANYGLSHSLNHRHALRTTGLAVKTDWFLLSAVIFGLAAGCNSIIGNEPAGQEPASMDAGDTASTVATSGTSGAGGATSGGSTGATTGGPDDGGPTGGGGFGGGGSGGSSVSAHGILLRGGIGTLGASTPSGSVALRPNGWTTTPGPTCNGSICVSGGIGP
jgi:hypothetical protein